MTVVMTMMRGRHQKGKGKNERRRVVREDLGHFCSNCVEMRLGLLPNCGPFQGELRGRTNLESGLHLSALLVFIYPELLDVKWRMNFK